jgi:hypothetical protein
MRFSHCKSPSSHKAWLLLEQLEDRSLPATGVGLLTAPAALRIAACAFQTGSPNVIVRDAAGNQLANFYAFPTEGAINGQPVSHPLSIAVGDVNGDGVPDIIVSRVFFGFQSEVRVIDGSKLNMVDANQVIEPGAVLADFLAYDPLFLGGANVAFGMSGTLPEIITGAGPGGGPHVKVIDATKLGDLQSNEEIADSALVAQFYAYDPRFNGGVHVAAADLNGDGVLDIVTGAGPGGGPHVKAIDGREIQVGDLANDSEPASSSLFGQFYAYAPTFREGVNVAASNVGGHPIIVTGIGNPFDSADPDQPVKEINATQLDVLDNDSVPTGSAVMATFFAFAPRSDFSEVLVVAADINGDGVADIVAGSLADQVSPEEPQQVKEIDGTKLTDLQSNGEISDTALLGSFSFPLSFAGGSVYVAA